MRYPVLVFSALMLSAGVAAAQTGFSTKTYPAVLPATSDNTQLLTADFNGDGRPDLLSYGSRDSGSSVSGNVFLNNGSGGFSAPVALPGAGFLASAMIGDMNGDGYPDIVGCENYGSGKVQALEVIVYLNNGNGTFKALPAVTGNGQCNALTLGDVYQTGHLDVVTAGYTNGQYGPGGQFYTGNTTYLDIFSNPGTGTLALKQTGMLDLNSPATSSTYTNCGAIDVVGGDFLNNGDFDLILTSSCQPTGQTLSGYAGTVFYSTGVPTDPYANATLLQAAPELHTNGQAVNISSNGNLDAVFLGRTSATSGSLIYAMNNGGESFTFSKLLTSAYFEGAAVADFTGNGVNDIATTYDPNITSGAPAGPPELTLLNGSSTGTFTTSQTFATGAAGYLGGGVVAADFTGTSEPGIATLVYDTSTKTTSLNVYTNTLSTSACATPTATNTNIICSPSKGAGDYPPVTVTAASNVTGFTLNRLYLDNVSVYQADSQQISTSINAAIGDHTLVLVSYDNTGKAFTYSTTFTVIGNAPSGPCPPLSAGVTICTPATGSTLASPITVQAGAMAKSGLVTSMRVYVDNTSMYTLDNTSANPSFQVTGRPIGLAPGSHRMVVVGYESTGAALTGSSTFTISSPTCTASTTATSLVICSPSSQANPLYLSPVEVSAAAHTSTGYIASMRIYIDNVAVALLDNSQKTSSFTINQSLPAAAGTHKLVVVAYPSTGGSITDEEGITVQ